MPTINTQCLACGSVLPTPTKRHRETHHTSYCEACLEGIREGKVNLVCTTCRVSQPPKGNFQRAGNSRTGYLYTCRRCAFERTEVGARLAWLREQIVALRSPRRLSRSEMRRREARKTMMRLNAHGWVLRAMGSGPALPPDQVIYVLSDPRNDEVRYVGQTHDLKARYKAHLRSDRREYGGFEERKQWIASLRAIGLRPTIRVVEQVEPGANVYERERRWMFHYVHRGLPLLNGELKHYPRLFRAVLTTELDYLSEPPYSPAWSVLFDAWWEDTRESESLAEERGIARLRERYEAEITSLTSASGAASASLATPSSYQTRLISQP